MSLFGAGLTSKLVLESMNSFTGAHLRRIGNESIGGQVFMLDGCEVCLYNTIIPLLYCMIGNHVRIVRYSHSEALR